MNQREDFDPFVYVISEELKKYWLSIKIRAEREEIPLKIHLSLQIIIYDFIWQARSDICTICMNDACMFYYTY